MAFENKLDLSVFTCVEATGRIEHDHTTVTDDGTFKLVLKCQLFTQCKCGGS